MKDFKTKPIDSLPLIGNFLNKRVVNAIEAGMCYYRWCRSWVNKWYYKCNTAMRYPPLQNNNLDWPLIAYGLINGCPLRQERLPVIAVILRYTMKWKCGASGQDNAVDQLSQGIKR